MTRREATDVHKSCVRRAISRFSLAYTTTHITAAKKGTPEYGPIMNLNTNDNMQKSRSDSQAHIQVPNALRMLLLVKHAIIGRLLYRLLIHTTRGIRHRHANTPPPVRPAGLVAAIGRKRAKCISNIYHAVVKPLAPFWPGGMTRAPSSA